MSLQSDLYFDKTSPPACGHLLHQHYAGKHIRDVLREHEGEIFFATMVEVTCSFCGSATEIFYTGEPVGFQGRTTNKEESDVKPMSNRLKQNQPSVKEGYGQTLEKRRGEMNEISDLTETVSLRLTKEQVKRLRQYAGGLGVG